jgi:acyl-CoA dehydrogenase
VARVAVLAGDHVLSLAPEAVSVEPGANLAGEPRDTLLVDCIVDRAEQARVQPGTDELLRRRQVLVRIALMAGAAQRALSSTLRYVSEREQFGRPLSGFQAVQQQVAELAGETAAMRISVDAAIDLCGRHGLEHDRAGDVLAAAKVQAGRGAGRVARIAHQLHGAIGLTDEHSLGLATTRLWAWRDEAGSEAEWACELGARVLDRGAEGLWCFITG